MTRSRTVIAAILALCASLAADAVEAGETLRWKFQAGETIAYVVQQGAVVAFNTAGVEFQIKTHQTLDMTWSVKNVAEDGSAQVVERVDRLRIAVHAPGAAGGALGDLDYDSQSEKQPEGRVWERAKPVLTALPGAEFSLRIGPDGTVSDIELPAALGELLDRQPAARVLSAGGSLFSREAIRQTLQLCVLGLPKEAVETGAGWTRRLERPVPPVGSLLFDLACTYNGPASVCGRDVATIGVAGTTTFQPSADGDRESELELVEEEGSGTAHFDAAAGRTVASTFTQHLVLDGGVGDNSFTQEIDATISLALAECPEAEVKTGGEGAASR